MMKGYLTIFTVLLAGAAFGEIAELREGDFVVKPNRCPSCPMRMRFADDGKTAFINTSLVSEKEFPAEANRAFMLMKKGLANSKRTIAVTLNVTPLPGESHTSGTGYNRNLNLMSSSSLGPQSRTKTTTRTMKWRADLRIRDREERPEMLSLEAVYIAMEGNGKLKELKREVKTTTLDKNGCATLEFESPKTTLTKQHTTVSRGGGFGGLNSGFRSTKTTTRGERVTGCVIRVFAEGRLLKSWASDSRWTSAAQAEKFSVAELEQNKSRIGLR